MSVFHVRCSIWVKNRHEDLARMDFIHIFAVQLIFIDMKNKKTIYVMKIRKRIRKVVKEEINKFVAQSSKNKKLDLNKVFDLSKISDDELSSQHYDISLAHAFSGYGSLLLKDNGNTYIIENDGRVTPVSQVKHELDWKYGFAPWQIRINDRGHDIQICVCIADFKQGVDEIVNDFKQMGYFLSKTSPVSSPVPNQKWLALQFEPLYQVDEFNKILNYGDLYHLTPAYNIQNILANGLQPMSENGMFDYPNRIFMFVGNTPIQKIEDFGYQLFKVNSNPNNDGMYVLLRIDSQKLRNGYSFHYDPNYEYGVYTENTIPSNFISIMMKFNFKKD